jgi:hypothetical protein
VKRFLEAGEVGFEGWKDAGEEQGEEAYKRHDLVGSVEGFGLRESVLAWRY